MRKRYLRVVNLDRRYSSRLCPQHGEQFYILMTYDGKALQEPKNVRAYCPQCIIEWADANLPDLWEQGR